MKLKLIFEEVQSWVVKHQFGKWKDRAWSCNIINQWCSPSPSPHNLLVESYPKTDTKPLSCGWKWRLKISLGVDTFLFIKTWDTGCWVELSKLQWKPSKPRNQKTLSSKQERRGPFPGAQLPGCHNMKKTRWLVVFVVNIQLQTNSSIR